MSTATGRSRATVPLARISWRRAQNRRNHRSTCVCSFVMSLAHYGREKPGWGGVGHRLLRLDRIPSTGSRSRRPLTTRRGALGEAAGLRIRHARQAGENNLHTIAVEEELSPVSFPADADPSAGNVTLDVIPFDVTHPVEREVAPANTGDPEATGGPTASPRMPARWSGSPHEHPALRSRPQPNHLHRNPIPRPHRQIPPHLRKTVHRERLDRSIVNS